MYQLVNAYLRPHGKNKTWSTVDISLLLLNVVFTKYNDGYITVLNTAIDPNPLYVDLQELKNAPIAFLSLPFENWLQWLGNKPLPFLTQEPVYTTKTITYSDANQAGFDITRIHPTFVIDDCGPNPIFTNNELSDLRVEKNGVSVEEVQKYILCTVNGYLHPTIPIETGVQIKGAALSVDICRENSVGLLSFKNIGEIEQVPITSDMLSHVNNFPARYEYYINLNRDISGKSVMMSIGGYLHVEDDTFDIVSYELGIIKVSLTRVNVLRRLFEMQLYLNLTSLVYNRSVSKPDTVNVLDFYKNENIEALLTMVQSFVIIVDTDNLYFEREITDKSQFPNVYEYGVEPTVPLRIGTGRLPEYWRTCEHNTWVMSLSDTLHRDYLHETTEWSTDGIVNSRLSEFGLQTSKAHLFYIRTQKRE